MSGYLRMLQDRFKETVPKAIVHKVGRGARGIGGCIAGTQERLLSGLCTSRLQMVHASKEGRLLAEMHAVLMTAEQDKLQRMLIEDEGLMKRREMVQNRLALMNRAAAELSSASF